MTNSTEKKLEIMMHLLTPKYRRHWSQRQMKTRRRRVEIGAMTYEKPKLRSLHLTKSHIQGNEKVLQTIQYVTRTLGITPFLDIGLDLCPFLGHRIGHVLPR